MVTPLYYRRKKWSCWQ